MDIINGTRRQLVALSGLLSAVAGAVVGSSRAKSATEPPSNVERTVSGSPSAAAEALHPTTREEAAVGATITSHLYPAGDLRRYGGDPTGETDSSHAWSIATAVGRIYIAPNATFKVLTGSSRAGRIEITGEGSDSVVLCDGTLLTVTGADWSHIDNFALGPVTTPLVFQRNVVNTAAMSADTRAGDKTIEVLSAAGISIGMQAFGPGIWNGATVTKAQGTRISLSHPCTQNLRGSDVHFFSITFNRGAAALATVTRSLADGYRVPTLNDTDIWSSLTPAQQAASQKGPVFSLSGDHVTVERITGKFISFLFNECNYSTIRNCDFKGGWTWGCGAFLNAGKTRNRRNSAIGNRFREHGFEGILFMGVDGAIISDNLVYGCGDSAIEFYQIGPGARPVSTHYDGATGVTSSGNVCIGNYQGALNYEGNYGTLVGQNIAMCSSTGDYAAWHANGACAFTGSGWAINGLVCEHNPGVAVYGVISDSIMNGCTFRENQFENYGPFCAVTIVGTGNILSNIRASQATTRCRSYTLSVNAGSTGFSTTMMNIDLRDDVTPAQSCLLLSGNSQRLNVRTNGKYDQSLYSVAGYSPPFGSSIEIDLAQGTSFQVQAHDATAFNIENPRNTSAGTRFSVQVWNLSGGPLGSISWGSQYRLAPLMPPSGGTHVSIEFETNAGNDLHYEINRTPNGVPN
jgi:hypothetical protein